MHARECRHESSRWREILDEALRAQHERKKGERHDHRGNEAPVGFEPPFADDGNPGDQIEHSHESVPDQADRSVRVPLPTDADRFTWYQLVAEMVHHELQIVREVRIEDQAGHHPSERANHDADAHASRRHEIGDDDRHDRQHQQRKAIVQPGVDEAQHRQGSDAMGQGEVKTQEETSQRQGLHACHTQAKQEVGRGGPEREQAEPGIRHPFATQNPREHTNEGHRADDSGHLRSTAQVSERERHEEDVVEHVVIRVALWRQDRQRQPGKRRRETHDASLTHHLREPDVKRGVNAYQLRRRELQARQDEHPEREGRPRNRGQRGCSVPRNQRIRSPSRSHRTQRSIPSHDQ